MERDEIERRLRLGEDSRTEFKSAVDGGPPSDVIGRTIAALANSGGGDLFLGVEDDGTPSGVGGRADSDALQLRVVHICQQTVTPALRTRLQVEEIQSQRILVVSVPGHDAMRPFEVGKKYFVRDGPSTRAVRREELASLFASISQRHLEEEPVEHADLADLDLDLVDRLLRRRPRYRPAERERFLRAHQFLTPAGRPTYGGILMLGREPTQFISHAKVIAIRYAGLRVGRDFIDRKEFAGPLERQLEESFAFLLRHADRPEKIEGLTRRPQGIPDTVFREALVNMLAHRDYGVATPSRVFVFDDRIEISNPGGLLNHLTLDGIRLGLTQHRNPSLLAALTSLGYAEGAGTGVPMLIEALVDAGYPEPDFDPSHHQFKLTIATKQRRDD